MADMSRPRHKKTHDDPQASNLASPGAPLSPEALQASREWLIGRIPHSRALDLRIVDMWRGRAIIALPWAAHLVGNADTGVLAGGAITALLDSVSGSAVASLMVDIVPFATLDLRIDYNRPAEPRLEVVADAQCYRLTPNIAFTRATAHQGDPAQPVATAAGTFMIATRAEPRAEFSAAARGARGARR
jgi:uncharacterized protein (TIGR00369 family)